jgi:hypothetical protein
MSWEQLRDIIAEGRAEAAAQRAQRPQACPNDGQPLQEVNGVLHCPFDGWQWPRDAEPGD